MVRILGVFKEVDGMKQIFYERFRKHYHQQWCYWKEQQRGVAPSVPALRMKYISGGGLEWDWTHKPGGFDGIIGDKTLV
ncbi:hypothetical protein ACH5RR_009147 [Cinchona calisaya]|uniref:Uncharacterized protein n=1 Tax=Cinchona calisaya TaxID=153742 RepID=A0ABD3AGW9_9GENT